MESELNNKINRLIEINFKNKEEINRLRRLLNEAKELINGQVLESEAAVLNRKSFNFLLWMEKVKNI